jgi:hypothetical protein
VTNPAGEENLNWRPILFCCGAGAVLVSLAFLFQTCWKWTGVTEDALIEAGIALAFVGLAFLAERRFVRGVARVAASAAEATFAEQTRQLQTRVDELSESVHARDQKDADEQDDLVAQLEYPSYERVMSSLEEAQDFRALGGNSTGVSVRVTASSDRDLLSLTFFRYNIVQNVRWVLQITVHPQAHARVPLTNAQRLRWEESESADDAGHKISREIRSRGLLAQPDDFDWSLAIGNLRKSLDVAFRSKRREPGAWHLDGSLHELLGDDWAVTTAGLEHRPDPPFLVPAAEFLRRLAPGRDPRPEESARQALLNMRPTWCEEQDWEWLTRRAQAHF